VPEGVGSIRQTRISANPDFIDDSSDLEHPSTTLRVTIICYSSACLQLSMSYNRLLSNQERGFMRQRLLMLLFLQLLGVSSLRAQNAYNFSQFGNETVDFIKQPVQWNGNDWLKIGWPAQGHFSLCSSTNRSGMP
jgi:hypothetical protein